MKQLEIIKIDWKQRGCSGTKKDFDNGKDPYVYYPIIRCKIEPSYDFFKQKRPVIVEGLVKNNFITANICGYHLSEDWMSFEVFMSFSKEDSEKANIKLHLIE